MVEALRHPNLARRRPGRAGRNIRAGRADPPQAAVTPAGERVMKRPVLWVPLAIFVVFVAMIAFGLYSPSDRKIPSRLVGKPIPGFALPAALPQKPGLERADFTDGEPRLLNFFA